MVVLYLVCASPTLFYQSLTDESARMGEIIEGLVLLVALLLVSGAMIRTASGLPMNLRGYIDGRGGWGWWPRYVDFRFLRWRPRSAFGD